MEPDFAVTHNEQRNTVNLTGWKATLKLKDMWVSMLNY